MGLITKQRDRLATFTVAALVAGGVTFAAVREEGYKADDVTLHENGVWVTRSGEFGRVNMDLYKVDLKEGRIPVQDVLQSGSTVVVRSQGKMVAYDVALAQMIGNVVQVPEGAEVGLSADSGGLLDPQTGRFWFVGDASLAAVKSIEEEDLTPGYVELPGASQLVMGTDGRAHVVDPAAGLVWHFIEPQLRAPATAVAPSTEGTDGAAGTTTTVGGAVVVPAPEPVRLGAPLPEEDLQLTVVGTRVVFLTGSTLSFEDGRSVDLSSLGQHLVLQQPGADDQFVLVASERGLTKVDVGNGDLIEVHQVADGVAVAPVALNGCVYGAWATGVFSSCSNPNSRDDIRVPDGSVFRTNRGHAVLNFPDGTVIVFPADADMEQIENTWSDALDSQEQEQQETEEEPTDELDPCAEAATGNTAPEVPSSVAFTVRAGRSTRLDVLNPQRDGVAPASDAECDVLTVELADDLGDLARQVAVVDNGRALQFVAAADERGEVSVPYTVSDGSTEGTVQRTATVSVIGADDDGQPPVAVVDNSTVQVGMTVVLDVLANDWDPDGDALVVQSFDATGDDGRVVWQPGGRVAYTAPASGVGQKSIRYTVVDAQGKVGEATLNVEVVPPGVNIPPKARPDVLRGMLGAPGTLPREFSINVLENDSDPNGDALTVSAVEGYLATLNTTPPTRHDDGTLTFTPPTGLTERTAFNFAYTVSDGDESVTEHVRFDIIPFEADALPVAVADDAVASSTQPTVIDVLRNDFDLNGDVLMVTDAAMTGPGLDAFDVEIVEYRLLRLTASGSPVANAKFQLVYTITDGTSTSTATVDVTVSGNEVPQPPVTTEDTAQVHLGGYLSVPVLANDFDPNGNTLSVLSAKLDDKVSENGDPGFVFVQNNQVRYVPPTVAQRSGPFSATGEYVVTNGRDTATGRFVIAVTTTDENRPPNPDPVELRVPGGDADGDGNIDPTLLTLPSYGLDPDGDLVVLVGELESPTQGTVVSAEGNTALEYTPLAGHSGTDVFRWRLRDSLGAVGVLEVRVVVSLAASGNRPPIAVRDSAEVAPGDVLLIPVLLNDSDPDGDVITFDPGKPFDPATRGTVAIAEEFEGFVSYSAPSEVGDYAFNYYITDSLSAPVRGLVQVSVLPADQITNMPPLVRDVRVDATAANVVVTVELGKYAVDPEGAVLDFAVGLDAPSDAAIDLADPENPKLTFTMGREPLVFTFIADDGQENGRAYGVVQVPTPSNRAPVAELQVVEIGPEEAGTIRIDLDKNWVDPDGDPIEINLDSTPELSPSAAGAGGEVEFSGEDTIVFNRDPEFSGEALITFYIYDVPPNADDAMHVPAKILLKIVSATNTPPEVIPETIELFSDTTITFDLARVVSDADPGDEALLQFSDATWEGGGDIDLALVGSTLRLTAARLAVPTRDGRIDATVEFTVDDTKEGGRVSGALNVVVLPVDLALPQAVDDDPGAVDQGQAPTWTLTANDPPNGSEVPYRIVTVSGVSSGHNGSPLGNVAIIGDGSSGSVRFTPTPNESGNGSFTYTIEDEQGTAATATVRFSVRDVPEPPGQPIVGDQLSRTAVLTFGLPFDNGAPIDSYEARSSAGTDSCSGSPCTIEGLENGVPLRFEVRAHNEVGWGDWSSLSPEYTPDELPGRPSAPVLEWDDHSVRVSWGQLPNDGSDITNVRVTVSPPPTGGAFRDFTGGELGGFLDFTGLENGTTYTFSMVSTNGKGNSLDSPGASATPVGPPQWSNTPTLVAWNGYAEVSWSGADGNGDNAVRYTVELLTGGSVASSTDVGTATSVPNIPITNGLSYTARIVAENLWTDKHGDPRTSLESLADRGEQPPGAPPSFSASAIPGTGTVRLDWGAADNGGGTISTYQVAFSTSPGSFNNWSSVGTDVTVVLGTGNGLVLGTGYYFAVRALNDNREGVPGAASEAGPSTPYGIPTVTASCVADSLTQITCGWNVTAWNGSVGTVSVSGDYTNTNAGSPGSHVFSGLSYDTPRGITVVATNGQGGVSAPASASARTPMPTVTISRGNFNTVASGTCAIGECKWVVLNTSGWNNGQSLTMECISTTEGSAGTWVRTAAGGSFSTSGLWMFGAAGDVYCTVNGVTSNVVSPWKNW